MMKANGRSEGEGLLKINLFIYFGSLVFTFVLKIIRPRPVLWGGLT